jgi:hypothetical protein
MTPAEILAEVRSRMLLRSISAKIAAICIMARPSVVSGSKCSERELS